MIDHANELRRYSRKIGHPAGDVPSVMLAAADEIERLAERLEEAEQERDALRAENERIDEAMESLLIRCDDSDSAMYGTLSTSFVRDTVRIARAAPEESK